MKKQFSYDPECNMLTVSIRDQTAQNLQSDLDLHFPQKLPVLSSVRKELRQKPS